MFTKPWQVFLGSITTRLSAYTKGCVTSHLLVTIGRQQSSTAVEANLVVYFVPLQVQVGYNELKISRLGT
jgi:hypothetical protein